MYDIDLQQLDKEMEVWPDWTSLSTRSYLQISVKVTIDQTSGSHT